MNKRIIETIEAYSIVYLIDIVETDKKYEAWWYEEDGIEKYFMFSCPKEQQSKEDFTLMAFKNIDDYIECEKDVEEGRFDSSKAGMSARKNAQIGDEVEFNGNKFVVLKVDRMHDDIEDRIAIYDPKYGLVPEGWGSMYRFTGKNYDIEKFLKGLND